MRSTYVALARLVALGVVLQAAFIAFGTFDVINVVEDGEVYDGDYNSGQVLHSLGAMAISVVGLALLIVSFFAKLPGGVKWAAIVFGVIALQWVLAIAAFEVGAVIGLLHGINAVALAVVAERAGARVAKLEPAAGPERPRTTTPA